MLLPFLCFFDKELLFAAHLRQENIRMIVFGQVSSQNTLRQGKMYAILCGRSRNKRAYEKNYLSYAAITDDQYTEAVVGRFSWK